MESKNDTSSFRGMQFSGSYHGLDAMDTKYTMQLLESKVARLRGFYSTLARINAVITHVQDEQSLFQEVCKIAVDTGGFRMCWIGRVGEDGWIHPVAQAGHCPEYMDDLRTSANDFPMEGHGPTGTAVRENRSDFVMDLERDSRTLPWRDRMLTCGFKSAVASPIRRHGAPLAVFTLYAGEMNVFGQEEVQLVEEMTEAISFAVEYLEHNKLRLQAEQQAHFLAYYDDLTKLPNRVSLLNWLRNYIGELKQPNQTLAVALLDLDGFKEVNDHLGHVAGDKLLQEVAQRLQRTLTHAKIVARLGGDEFVFVLDNVTSKNAVTFVLDALKRAIKVPIELEGRPWRVNCSIGVVIAQTGEVDADTVLRHADIAMYEAKRKGRDQYAFFDEEVMVRREEEKLMREAVERAITNHELTLHYQPQVSMRTGKVVGVEALLRWNHPEEGLLSPIRFLPAIQNYPVMNEVGKWVLREALGQLTRWQSEGLNLKMSVNISASQFQNAMFVSELVAILAHYPKISPLQLKLELLEDAITENFDVVRQNIDQCNRLGISVSLDDFGTGYSSLTHLQRLAVSEVKIDQTFVRDLLDDAKNIAIVSGLLSTALPSQLEVVAEGVEDIETGRLLRRLGCENAQGYAIARPMSADEVVSWVRQWQNFPSWGDAHPWRILNDDLPAAVAGFMHRRLVDVVLESLNEESPFSHFHINPHTCEFGRWCNSVGREHFDHLTEFHDIVRVHDTIAALIERTIYFRDKHDMARAKIEAEKLMHWMPIFVEKIDTFIAKITTT